MTTSPGIELRHLHWGGPLTDDDARALARLDPLEHRRTGTESHPRAHDEEYPWRGGLRSDDSALFVAPDPNDRTLDLRVSAVDQPSESELVVTLRDELRSVDVAVHYEAFDEALHRWAVVQNNGSRPLLVHEAASASWSIPVSAELHLTTLTGRYGAEFGHERAPLRMGRQVLESRVGIPGHEASPWVALDRSATEAAGEVWSVGLAHGGSYRLTTHRHHDHRTTVTAGVNPFDLSHELAAGQSLTLPRSIGVYSNEGMTGSTQCWHDHHRRALTPQPTRPRPVLYNSWEATFYDFSVADQVELARIAADLGVELFVVDDGWFRPDRDDRTGLGDWVAAPGIFPRGLGELADAVRDVGLDFGLWVEPEMANPISRLLTQHPDWALGWEGRTPTLVRHQRVLDYTRSDVRDWATSTLDALVTETGLAYLKWDMNRPVSETPGSGRVQLDQARGVAEVVSALRRAHPDLVIEGCASGGGRTDLSSQTLHHWMWVSDQSDAFERLKIQHGYSHVHPVMTMASWVTDAPAGLAGRDTPLEFRFDVAMSGVLGLGGDLRNWTAEERALAAAKVADYRRLRSTIHGGDLYRLPSPTPGDTSAVCHVLPGRSHAVLILWCLRVQGSTTRQWLRLRGLDPDASYRSTVCGHEDETQPIWSGRALMERGLPLDTTRWPDYTSRMIELTRV